MTSSAVLAEIVREAERATAVLDRKKHIPPPKHFSEIDCPCCRRKIEKPDFDVLVDYYKITPLQAAVLDAVWRGRGLPVPTERIFTVMYADDPDGGPSPNAMYRDFKVALHKLRKRLEGSGVTVENVGYRQGYRLVLGDKKYG
jgi:hypothetical protein